MNPIQSARIGLCSLLLISLTLTAGSLRASEAPAGSDSARELPGQPSISIAQKPFQINGRIPQSGYLSHSVELIPEDLQGIGMLRPVLGATMAIEPKLFVALNRIAEPTGTESQHTDPEQGSESSRYIHFSRGSETRVVRLSSLSSGSSLLEDLTDPDRRWLINTAKAESLGLNLDISHEASGTDLRALADERGSLVLPMPHAQSPVVLDQSTLRSRIKMSYPKLTRTLGSETFRARIPEKYDPSTPAGVLIWISPTPDGRIPQIFWPICDKLGLIAIGVDNNGNKREITDRLQNHLDSIETLAQNARIDRDRIYLTGMSGGGRCSGILQIAFPDYFAGAVPIVGLDTYHNAPTGNNRQYWPKRIGSKPRGPLMNLLKDRRIRSITGTADFNEPEMVLRTELLRKDGLNCKIDVIEGMAHSMPSALQFSKALEWVDEPRRTQIKENRTRAEDLFRAASDQDPTSPAVRKNLIEVMRLVPDSDLAWKAAGRLGYKKPSD